MSHVGEAAKLAFQSIQIGAAGAQECLEGDDLVADSVVYLVDHAHAARAQASHDVEALGAAELCVGSDGCGQTGRSRNERAASWADNNRTTSVSERRIICARPMDVGLARGGVLQQGFVKDRPQASMTICEVTHAPIFALPRRRSTPRVGRVHTIGRSSVTGISKTFTIKT